MFTDRGVGQRDPSFSDMKGHEKAIRYMSVTLRAPLDYIAEIACPQ